MSDPRNGERDQPSPLLIPYIATVVLLTAGGLMLVSQRARMARLGRETADYRAGIARTTREASRLELGLARLKSAKALADSAQRFKLQLVPPDRALEHEDETQEAPQP